MKPGYYLVTPDHVLPPGVGEHIQNLKDALLWALCQIEDDLDPDHQAALAAARALVED